MCLSRSLHDSASVCRWATRIATSVAAEGAKTGGLGGGRGRGGAWTAGQVRGMGAKGGCAGRLCGQSSQSVPFRGTRLNTCLSHVQFTVTAGRFCNDGVTDLAHAGSVSRELRPPVSGPCSYDMHRAIAV